MRDVVLLTGFEPYGGRGLNPSAEVARRLDGEAVGGAVVTGRELPVTYASLAGEVARLVAELRPLAVIGTGLWPGTATLRLERFAVNLADFEIADNAGAFVSDASLAEAGGHALPSRLPLREIEQALLDEGIPVTMSNSAGTFLCNAAMYHFLAAADESVPSGFVHLPYLPEQVAEILVHAKEERTLELHQRADLASMSIDVVERALRIVVETTVGALVATA
jgi:pyroglutamyl-peptidase